MGLILECFFDGTNTFNVDFEVSLKEVGQDWTISSGASVGEDKLDIDAGAFDFFCYTNCFDKWFEL